LSIGFVYILLNPAFPHHVKIGRTARNPQKRAGELSRQTGVPDDFIVLYEEIVVDAEQVEGLLHSRFSAYRTKKNKEFFQIPPKEAIKALQEIALRFPVPSTTPTLKVDMLPHFTRYFGDYLDPRIVAIHFIQLPGVCYLEVTRQPATGVSPITTQEEIPLYGLVTPDMPTLDDLRANEALLRSCDAYDWIMISDLFPAESASRIADEWERPGGKLEQRRQHRDDEEIRF
jgi:hypothetical protein